MTVQEMKPKMQNVYNASRGVIDAVHTLILTTEEFEEALLREKLPEEKMSVTELKELDNALKEMREDGKAISLEEFTRKHRPTIQSERSTTS